MRPISSRVFESNSESMPRRTLAELTKIAVAMVAKENLDAGVPDYVLAQRILREADPVIMEELGRALTHQRLVLWIQAERRKVERRMLATRPGDDKKTG
jgi:hypothetical protein